MLRRYVHGPGADDPLVWYEGSAVTASARRHLFADHQGSIVSVADSNGNPLGIDKYDDWGNPGSGNLGKFGYTGQLWISEVGLWHYKARAYNPALGRFMQTDPTGYDDDFNLYAYVQNDPIDGIDPDGTDSASFYVGSKTPELEMKSFREFASDVADFLPGIGDIKGVIEAVQDPTPVKILAAGVGFVPGAGDVGSKVLRRADAARAAFRDVMRQAGIPNSLRPVREGMNKAGRFKEYNVDGVKKAVVESRGLDRSHPGQRHFEAGRVKVDPRTGQTRYNEHGAPKLQNEGKAKCIIGPDGDKRCG